MAAPKTTIWSITDVTRTKHIILRQYLSWWLPYTLSKYDEAYILDGFAGPGEYEERDYGSPLIALDILHKYVPDDKFSKIQMLFIEKKQSRVIHLDRLISKQYSHLATQEKRLFKIRRGTFASIVDAYLTRLQQHGTTLTPTFVFVDPFGFKDTPMLTVSRLAQQPVCDMLVTFMYEEINRFLPHPKKSIQYHFRRLFGVDMWKEAIDVKNKEESICHLYCESMKQAGKVKYACKFRMMNNGNRTDYFLFFFTNDLNSLDCIKQIFWEIDPEWGTTFWSNYSQHEQLSLLPIIKSEQYQIDLLNHFKCKIVPMSAVDEYILSNTVFCRTRYKEKLLKPLERASKITVLSPNPLRQFGEYTEQESIQF